MKKLFIYAITGIIILLIYQFPYTMLNPGDLTSGHQDIKEKCSSCHKPFWGIENDRCISCHNLSEIGSKKLNGNESEPQNKKIVFHEKLINQKCVSCHTDHKGIKPEVELSSFTHDMLPEAMAGDCNGCHNPPSDKLHPLLTGTCNNCHNTKGWKSSVLFDHNNIQSIGKDNCISCHQKPNDDYHSSIEGNCSKCHTVNKWVPSTFDHSSFFQLDNNHNAKCNVCHTNNNFKTYTCYGCHEHTQSNIMEKHSEEGISDINNCVSCHKSGNENDFKNEGRSGNESEQNGINKGDESNKSERKDKDRKESKEEDDD